MWEENMNVELKRRTTSFSVPAPVPANDNVERKPEYGQSRRRAVIYKPAKSAMASGRAGTKRWLLEFEPQSAPFIEPLMGWTGSTDPMAHMTLSFPSREAAVAYAQRAGLGYEVRDVPKPVKEHVAAAKPQARPMPSWPIEMREREWSDLLIAEIGRTAFGRDVAA